MMIRLIHYSAGQIKILLQMKFILKSVVLDLTLIFFLFPSKKIFGVESVLGPSFEDTDSENSWHLKFFGFFKFFQGEFFLLFLS